MLVTIIVILISLVGLLVLHELGHFVIAKKFGVDVEEFGLGYPPRILGKKIGQTLYSVNLLPFGAFVKIKGEEGAAGIKDATSFGGKSLWQRALIILGGVLSFWLAAFVLLSIAAASFGIPTAVPDTLKSQKATVEIMEVAKASPAEKAGLKPGDIIKEIQNPKGPSGVSSGATKIQNVNKIKQVQEFTKQHLGEKITLTIKRGERVFDVKVLARAEHPKDQGPMGIGLVRVVWQKTPFYKAPLTGAKLTVMQTINIPLVLATALKRKLSGEKVTGVTLVGPIGVGKAMGRALQTGLGSFFFMVAMIAIWLALFNILPIPALDGGKLLFLAIEGIRKKPVALKTEQRITTSFFIALIALMVLVTLKDIVNLF